MKTRLTAITVLVIVMLMLPGVLYAQEPAAQPGDTIGEMVLETGGSEIVPIWAFCSPAFLNPGVTTTECNVPALPELAVGHGWWTADEALRDSCWEAMTWELYLDGRQVDLNAFGTFDADLPQTGLPGHDPNEEVITKLRSWDVVPVNPTAGAHTLRSVLHLSQQVDDGFHVVEAGTYELVVNFTVEAAPPAAVLPETGGTGLTGTLPLWRGVGGLLLLALGLGLRRVSGHVR
jgi:hypothetical protein